MSRRRSVLLLWVLGYAFLVGIGCRVEMQFAVALAALLILAALPMIMHLLACRRVMNRTRANHPEFWARIRGGSEVRHYLFDDQTFGDPELLREKAEVKWWLRAGILGVFLFLPTLWVIDFISK